MGIWFILLAPFFIMKMVFGNRRRREEEDEEVGSGTYYGYEGEEEEEEDEHENEGDGGDGNKKPKRTKHPCENMSQGLEEGKEMEPPNLYSPIVTKLTQVHIPA